jgi:hypothetical protein
MSAQDERQKTATPEDYVACFEGLPAGRAVLEDLVARFHDRDIYVPGGLEAARETEKRAAEKGVIAFVLRRLGQIHDRGEE